MADLERIYVVPLRRAKHTPATRRTKRAVKELIHFISRHMKAEEEKIWIDEPVNELLWSRGIQKPPTRIRVKAVKFEDDGVVEISLPEAEGGRKHRTEEERRAEREAKAAAALAAIEAEEKSEAEEKGEEEKEEKEEKAAEGEEKPAEAPAGEEPAAAEPAAEPSAEPSAEAPAGEPAEKKEG